MRVLTSHTSRKLSIYIRAAATAAAAGVAMFKLARVEQFVRPRRNAGGAIIELVGSRRKKSQ